MTEYLIWRCKCGSITAGGVAGMDPKGDQEFLRDHPGAEYVSDPPILQSCRCLARAEKERDEARAKLAAADAEVKDLKRELAAKSAECERMRDALDDSLATTLTEAEQAELQKARDYADAAEAMADRLGEALEETLDKLDKCPVGTLNYASGVLTEWRDARGGKKG